MKRICVVGMGYVGLVTAACFAEMGHRVVCVDTDEEKVQSMQGGRPPIYEPELDDLLRRSQKAGLFLATSSFEQGLKGADFVFMCVGTPPTESGEVDLSFLHLAYVSVASAVGASRPILVNKSTTPPGTTDMMGGLLARRLNGKGPLSVVCNPEFLREGSAVYDFMHPHRVVVGSSDAVAAEAAADLYRPLACPVLFTDAPTAEMIKYASNAFLATKVSFINEVARLCDAVGVDVLRVAEGVGLDRRIGRDFLNAGIGYGGSCLPKDLDMLVHLAAARNQPLRLLPAVAEVNGDQPGYLISRIRGDLGTLEGAKAAVLGLSFKPGTDDLRCSPALALAEALQAQGAKVRAYDPKAWRKASALERRLEVCSSLEETVRGSDVVVVATEWEECKELDLPRLKSLMRGDLLADGRNVLDPERVRLAGLRYIGVGRGAPDAVRARASVASD